MYLGKQYHLLHADTKEITKDFLYMFFFQLIQIFILFPWPATNIKKNIPISFQLNYLFYLLIIEGNHRVFQMEKHMTDTTRELFPL